MRLTLNEIAAALRVEAHGDADSNIVFSGVSTDTRTITHGDLFVALESEKADGHDFIEQAIAKGAIGVVVSKEVGFDAIAVFHVPDTTKAYGQIARVWRDKFDIPVIGVTGSVGKTTTKEMLVAALSPLGPILKTEASQNNETGVPKALLKLTSEHKAAVIEMGMRGAGQIDYLCSIANPTDGVITLIGENHIELLGSREAIVDAKGELFESLPENGRAFLNADDAFADTLRTKTKGRIITFGVDTPADFHADAIESVDGGWRFAVNGTHIAIDSPSRHDISNALAAFSIAVTLGVDPQDAAAALRAYAPPPMRMQIMTDTAWGGTVLNDAYNAAPASVRSALETLAAYHGSRKIAFLGDMKELGEFGHQAHRDLGVMIESLGSLDALYTVGALAAQIGGATQRFETSEEAAGFAGDLSLSDGDVVLVKGSRAMAMERIVEALTGSKAALHAH